MQRFWLREELLDAGAVDVDGLPSEQKLWAGGAEAGMVELEHVDGQLALFLVHMNRI